MRATMRRCIAALVICAATLLSGCRKYPENPVTPPFLKITDSNSGGTVYLMGTMHVGLPNTVYPQEVYDALDECETLAVEVDLLALDKDNGRVSAAMELLKCKDASTKEMLGGDYDKVRGFFREKRLYSTAYEKYLPAVWSSALTNKLAAECGFSSDYGTDRALLAYAKEHSIPIHELESIEEQYSVNANQSEALQAYSLVTAAETDWEEQKAQTRELYSMWSEGDLAALGQTLAEETVPSELEDDFEAFYFEMYESRQRKMAAYIAEQLENGATVFVAVGALHLAASPDIPELLEAEGYQVENVENAENAA